METAKKPTPALMVDHVAEIATREGRLNPFPWLQQMRETSPVRWDETRQSWDIFSYEAVNRVLQNHELFASAPPVDPATHAALIQMDQPLHTKFRAIVSKAFTPKVIADLAPRFQEIADELIDKVLHQKQMDLVDDFTFPLPVTVIAELLGVPAEDREKFKEWSVAMVLAPKDLSPESIRELAMIKGKAHSEMGPYFMQIVAQRRQAPQHDLISALAQAEVDGEQLTDRQIVSFCTILLVAGNETTTNLISNAMRVILDLGLLQQLKDNPLLIPAFVEEALRFTSPALWLPPRYAAADVEIGGHLIKAGQKVVCWLGSANRDEAKFENADQFVITRTPNPHVAFGFGIHFCLGAPLARLEAQIALTALTQRLTSVEYVAVEELEPLSATWVNGLSKFPISFTAVEKL